MSRCPKCEKEIGYLAAEMTDHGILRVHPDGTPDYEWTCDYGGNPDFIFKCPECGEVLFTDAGEAENFLKLKAKQTTLTK